MSEKARRLRVVLHAHSTWSYDGKWALSDIARFYGRFGVDAVMMTEHDTGFVPDSFEAYRAACAEASTRKCALIPGIEYSSPDNDIHILTWGLDRFLAEHRPVAETLARVADAEGAAIFAHPVRRDAWAQFDPDWTPLLSGIEIWNRKSDGVAPGARALDLIASTGLPATVGQDFHTLRHAYPLSHRVTAAPGPGLAAALVTALRAGATTPQAFGRDLLDARGTLRPSPHQRLERARVILRDLIRGKKR
jgi:hypothetical protein